MDGWLQGLYLIHLFFFYFPVCLSVHLSVVFVKKKKKKRKLSTVYAAMEKLGGCYAHQTDVG